MSELKNMREYAEQPKTMDMAISFVAFSALYCVARAIVRNSVEKAIRKNTFRISQAKISDATFHEKLKISCWELVSYSFLGIYALSYIPRLKWIYSPAMFDYAYEKMPRAILIQYSMEFLHFTLSLFFLFSEPRRKDFGQMVIHHVLTLLLVVFSYKKK